MWDKLSSYKDHPLWQQLQDMRTLGMVVFAAVMLLMTYSGVKVVHTNYQLQQQIARQKQENEIQKLKNENLKLQKDYYNTPQYLELAARQNFGLALPGEKELIVPKAVATAHIPAGVVDVTAESKPKVSTQPFMLRNLQAWADFFLHRTAAIE